MDKGIEINLDIEFHPGETLGEKLQEMEMSVEDFAEQSNLDSQYVKDVIACKASITPEAAVALEMVTKIPANHWLGMQHDFDDYILKQEKESWISKFIDFSRRTAAVL